MPTTQEILKQAKNKALRDQAAQAGGGPSLGERVATYYGDAGRAMLQGLTFGLGDEAIAKGRELLGGEDYETALGEERQRLEEMSPWIRYPGEFSGGLGTAFLGGAGAVGRAGQIASKIPAWARAIGLGGAYGGFYGFGTGEEGLEERGKSAATGAGFGAAGAAILHPLMRGAQMGAGRVRQAFQERAQPRRAAGRVLREVFDEDQITKGAAYGRLKEKGGQATLADIGGRNVRGAAREVTSRPGPGQNRAEQVLTKRAESEGRRVVSAVNRGVKIADYYGAEEAFLKDMETRAAPLYEKAYEANQSIMTPTLNRIIRGKVGRDAMKEAVELLEIERSGGQASYLGAVDDELTAALRSARDVGKTPGLGRVQPGVIKGFSLRTWDTIKRGLDSLLDKPVYRNELTGRLNAKGRAVYRLKRTLLRELDKATGGEKGAYARARAIYAGDAEALEALREGRRFMTKDPEAITRELADLSDTGRQAYRTGAARALKDVVDNTPEHINAANKIVSKARNRDRLKAIYSREDYEHLERLLLSEREFGRHKNYILGGSDTKPKFATEADILEKAAGAGALASGSDAGLMFAAMRRRIGQVLGQADKSKFYNELSKMLMSRNRAENLRALDEIFSDIGLTGLTPKAKRELSNAIIPLLSGQTAGRAAGLQSGQ